MTARRFNRNAALLVASFGALLAFLDVTIVNIAFPSIQATFKGASYGELSWVLNSYNIVFAALLVAAGRLADVFGRRRAFSLGVLVFTAASVGCAAAPDIAVLVLARIGQAIGAGLLVPASLALVVDAFPAERRAHAVGIWGATAAFAAGIGPPLGGALVQLESWRLAFLVNLPLGLAVLAVTGRVLVESRAPGRRRLPDLRGAALLGLATASVTVGIVEGPTWGWASPAVVAAFVAAAGLGAGFAWSSRRHPVPVLDPKLLRIPTFAVANVVTFVASVGFYAYMLNNILWLHYVWGWSLLRSGLAVAPGALVAAVVAGVLGHVADHRGHRLVAVPGALVWAAAYVWYISAVGTHPDFLGAWLPGQVLSGIGVGATLPVVSSAALAAVPGGRHATASAIVSSTRQLGAVVGVALLVDLVGSPSPGGAAAAFRHAWLLSVVCFGAAAVVGIAMRRHQVADLEEPAAPAPAELSLSAPVDRVEDTEHSPLLANLPEAARRQLVEQSPQVTVPGGAWLFRAGDPTDAMYVVQSGRLDVVGDDGVIRELGAGDVVGELGVLTGAPRSASVRARRDSILWRVTPERVERVLRADTAALRALTTSLALQVQANQAADGARTAQPPRVVAVVGVGDGAPVDRVADRLDREVGRHLRVLTSRELTTEELHRAEPMHDRVLLVASDPDAPWHGYALRQADRVVVVADAASPPADLGGRARHGYVVLVGPAPSTERLLAWHDLLAPRFLAVADAGSIDDVTDSIGRRLAGRSIGVALAGGGARSLSGIGVLEELYAAGFHVDRFAGCSVGSVVAALFACGHDAASVDAACYEEFVRRNPFNDFRIPTVSIARGRKAEAGLARLFGGTLLEQLPRELAVVSTDLLGRQLVVHRRGRVSTAVRASLSLPGLFPPVRLGDTLQIDGGVLDNLPVQSLTEVDEGPVVGVNIGAAASGQPRSGGPRMPSLGETLMRTMLMAGTSTLAEARQQAALLVTPDTRGIGLLEFHQIDRAREAGRVAGRGAAEALQDLLSGRAALPEQRRREPVVWWGPATADGRVGAPVDGAGR